MAKSPGTALAQPGSTFLSRPFRLPDPPACAAMACARTSKPTRQAATAGRRAPYDSGRALTAGSASLYCMARCISFVQLQQHTAAWARCVRRARPDDVFCTVHRDAINGVMMGILHHTEPYHVTKEQIEEACRDAGARTIAFENAIAMLNVPTGIEIRPGWRRPRKIGARRKQEPETQRAGDAEPSGGEEAAATAATTETHADGRGVA
jgi:hypothetical protein